MVILYGAPLSLYTGRVRSYLIKTRTEYREQPPVTQHYEDVVLDRAGGRRSMPTVEFPDGKVIRDSVAILDHFEQERGHPHSPLTPKQRVVSRLIDAISAEGLLRPAMHYRWHFPAENEKHVFFHFDQITPLNAPPDLTVEGRSRRMLQACIDLGVGPEHYELVEALYQELLSALDAHFDQYPYLLGGKPCIGDFGLIAPMFAHLGRDPKPLSIMQANALRVCRWVERMNRPEPDMGEFETKDETYIANDEIPDSLINVLKILAVDYVPETRAACQRVNTWLEEQGELPSGTTVAREVGKGHFEVRQASMSAAAQPFRFYLLKRVQDEIDVLDEAGRAGVMSLLDEIGMAEILKFRLTREIGRSGNLEVWR